MSKWTAGPWCIHEHMGGLHETDCENFVAHTAYIGSGDVLLGEVTAYRFRPGYVDCGYPRPSDFAENIANAHLISAAPELAEALEPFVALLQDHHEAMPDAQPMFGINDALILVGDVRRARTALAKARGEA